MAWEEVAEGGFVDLAGLSRYEPYFEEGDRGLLQLDLRLPVSAGVAQTLENMLANAGVPNVKVRTASPQLRIYFQKGFPWLAVIAAIILGLIVLAVLIIGWGLFREIPGGLGVGLGIAVAVAGLLVLAYVGTREVMEEKAKKIIYG